MASHYTPRICAADGYCVKIRELVGFFSQRMYLNKNGYRLPCYKSRCKWRKPES